PEHLEPSANLPTPKRGSLPTPCDSSTSPVLSQWQTMALRFGGMVRRPWSLNFRRSRVLLPAGLQEPFEQHPSTSSMQKLAYSQLLFASTTIKPDTPSVSSRSHRLIHSSRDSLPPSQ